MAATVLVSDVIERNGVGTLQKTILAICGIAIVCDGFDAQALAYVAPLVAKDLGMQRYELAPLFTASLVGLAAGGFLLSFLSDKVGRKWVFLLSMALFGGVTVAKGFATNATELLVYQFVAGLGIGGAPPVAFALLAEYMPKATKNAAITYVAMGYLVGATLGGLVAASVLPVVGWRVIFFLGGGSALVVGAAIAAWVPESVRFLLSRSGASADRRAAEVMGRIDPALTAASGRTFSCEDEERTRTSASELFQHGRAAYTVLMWVVVALIGIVNYILFSWLAVLFEQAGVGLTQSVLAATAFPFGSMLASLWLSSRLRDSRAALLLAGFAGLYAATLVAMGHLTFSFPLLVAAVFLAGVGSGPQGVTHALNAAVYPTLVRTTGIGWSSSIGRVGGAIGPLIGGGLIALGWSTAQILTASALPILGVIGAFLALSLVRSTRSLMDSRLRGTS